MIARFDADVRAHSPDFVHVMVGTNDYYAGVSNANFQQQLNQIRSMIQSIGAQMIVYTATVGAQAPTLGGGDQLQKSRSYALNIKYEGKSYRQTGQAQSKETLLSDSQ